MAEDWSRYAVSSDNSDNAPKTDWSQYAEKEQPGILDRISEGVSKLTEEHPQVASKIREIFTGTSPELEAKKKEAGIVDTKGPGLMEVPGTRKLSDAVREAGRTSGSYWKGFGASLLGDVIDLAGSGFDPRAVSPEKIPFKTGELVPEEAAPIADESRLLPPARFDVSPKGTVYAGELPIRRSVETPYRMEETAPPSTDIVGPIRRPSETLIPPTDVAREFAPVGEEGDLLKPSGFVSDKNADELSYELAKKKFGMGEELPEEAPEEQPLFARTSAGGIKVEADIRRAAGELTSGYSQPLPAIMAREALQNAIDATRHLGDDAKIAVTTDDNGLTVSDNGKGMNRQELETVFSNLHSSGKATQEGATGGKGIGKATYMLGGNNFKAETVTFQNGKKIKYTIEGTPEQFMEHVPIKEEQVPLNTPTGTTIRTDYKEGQEAYNAREMVQNIIDHTRGVKGQISFNRYGRAYEPEPIKFNTHGEGDIMIGKTNIDNNGVEVSIPKGEQLKPRQSMYVNILNNGMYQYRDYKYLPEETPNMPENLILNISPGAHEGSPEYPFPTQRESIKTDLKKKIDEYIDEKLINPQKEGRKTDLRALYASMPEVPVEGTKRPTVIFDPGKRMTSSETEEFQTSPVVNKMVKIFDNTIEGILQKADKPKWSQRLEKVGLVLDPNMHGVHIPNPDTGKSTILINPFEHISNKAPEEAALDTIVTALHEAAHIGTEGALTEYEAPLTADDISDPRVGRYLQSYLNQTMTHGGLDLGHGVAFLKRLGIVYSKFGTRSALDAANEYQSAITDKSGGYNPEVQRLLQIYKASRGRAETTPDFLSGTGVKQAIRSGGKRSVSGDGESDGRGTLRSAIAKLFTGLQEAKEKNLEQTLSYRAEKAKRFAAFEGVKQTGAAGAAKSLGKLRGEYEKLPGVQLGLNEAEVDSLFNAVKQARITTGEKARGYVALFKMLNGEDLPQRNEIRLLDDVFGNGFADRIIQLHGGLGATGIKLAKAANTMKSAMTLVHFSAPLRQGLGLIHTPEWRDAFVQMFKYFGNKTYYDAAMQAIEQRPNYLLGRQAGLFMSKPSSFLEGEEEFMNNYIPGLPSGIKSLFIKDTYEASQRAYIGFLNKLRADTFDDLISDVKKIGHEAFTVSEDAEGNKSIVPSKTTENIAKFINNATGRGSLGALEKIAPELNTFIWSPRLIVSRLNYLNPKYYAEFDSFTRKQAIKSLFAIAASSSAILGLAKLAGAKVSNDPTSADFHKARFPKGAVLDPNGGYQQPIVAAARIINEANRMGKGIKARFGEPTIPDIAGNFLVSKLSPMAGLAYDIATAKQFTGGGGYVNRFGSKTSVQSETMNRFLSIFAQDTYKLIQTDPGMAELLGAGTANLFGAGLQDYPEKRPFSSRGVRVPMPSAR